MSVSGIGVLIIGESGTGKSDCAFDLIARGHSLVADDVVEIERNAGTLLGRSPKRFAGLINIRRLGLVDVRHLYSEHAFVQELGIDLIVELNDAEAEDQEKYCKIAGLELPKFTFRANSPRNLPLLIETAVKMVRDRKGDLTGRVFSAHNILASATAK